MFAWVAVALAATAAVAAQPEFAHEICQRRQVGRETCVRLSDDCKQAQPRCQPMSPKECKALIGIVSKAIDGVESLPAKDRAESQASLLMCEGLQARSGKRWAGACYGKNPGGVELLSAALRLAEGTCDAD